MLNAPGYNPLDEKRKSSADGLNRARETASGTSLRVAADRSDFFYRLAVLNGGALTFSVTLLGNFVPLGTSRLWVLFFAWFCFFVGLVACLLRNLSHQGYQFARAASKRAESEIAYIDVDTEILESGAHIAYSDSAEPFDSKRELRINKGNREAWQNELDRHGPAVDRRWKFAAAMEWLAGITTAVGFLLLIGFAVANASVVSKQPQPTSYPVHIGPD